MSRVLVIPDVHLKPWMFDQAVDIMETTDCDRAVCLGDLVDDWNCERKVKLYKETLDKAIDFARRYPDTLWCYGNHDLAYLWDQYDHPGFSDQAADMVCDKLEELRDTLEYPENLAIVHRLDNVIFSHAGLTLDFVENQMSDMMDDIDCLIEVINGYGVEELWEVNTPIWVRPQYDHLNSGLYPPGYLQVVGHTPVKEIMVQKDIITVDTFSTYRSFGGRTVPIGNEEFYWVDTRKKEWGKI